MKVSQVCKIVLTGGPCGGKTTAVQFLKHELANRGVEVFCLKETATRLMNEGKTPESMGSYGFHSLLFREQLAEERRLEALAASSDREKAVILCDRGLLDNKAYVEEEHLTSAVFLSDDWWRDATADSLCRCRQSDSNVYC